MLRSLRRGVRAMLRKTGYDIVPLTRGSSAEFPADFDDATIQLCRYVREFTKTSKERIYALRQSVQYVVEHEVLGDIVECGVWRGGSMMAVARTLLEMGVEDRKLYLFDTFEGMSEPGEFDRNVHGHSASRLLDNSPVSSRSVWSFTPLDDVRRNMRGTGYDEKKVVFVKGRVEDTLPANAPDRISVLRLDTDWYESTYHELAHLYPRLSVGGVLIIDDYGHWAGSRRAVDEYFKSQRLKVLLHRIDYTGRLCVKVDSCARTMTAGDLR